MKLDIACGQNKREGFTGIDSVKVSGVDIVHDLNQYPWPFEDNSIEEINCSHYVEHAEDLCKFMDECFRVLVPGGKMQVVAPYYTSVRCWQDPTHRRAISEMTFMYFNAGWRLSQKLDHYPIKCDFDFTYGYSINSPWNQKAEESRNFAITHYWNVVSDIIVTLTKRQPT